MHSVNAKKSKYYDAAPSDFERAPRLLPSGRPGCRVRTNGAESLRRSFSQDSFIGEFQALVARGGRGQLRSHHSLKWAQERWAQRTWGMKKHVKKAARFDKVELDALIEEITVDADGDAEQIWAFRQAFEDNDCFAGPRLQSWARPLAWSSFRFRRR